MEQGQTEIEAISAEITLFRQKYLLSVSFCSFGYLTVDFCFLPKLHILKPPLSVSAETLSVAHYGREEEKRTRMVASCNVGRMRDGQRF